MKLLRALVDALVRIAAALEAISKRPRSERDTGAGEELATLRAEVAAWMVKAGDAINELQARDPPSADLIARFGRLEAEHDITRRNMNSLKSKVYRDPAYRKSEDEPARVQLPRGIIGGPIMVPQAPSIMNGAGEADG